jgi:hypothetical protein
LKVDKSSTKLNSAGPYFLLPSNPGYTSSNYQLGQTTQPFYLGVLISICIDWVGKNHVPYTWSNNSATLLGCTDKHMHWVGKNHVPYIRYFRQGNHQIYRHMWCIYTVLDDLTCMVCSTTGRAHKLANNINMNRAIGCNIVLNGGKAQASHSTASAHDGIGTCERR